MSDVHIFIGPRKTGTSWLHHVASSDSQVKEIRYPSAIGRKYVYRRYVEGQNLLIWPYLIHEPKVLNALIDDLKEAGRNPILYWSEREENDWIESMTRFEMKYGANEVAAQKRAVADFQAVSEARAQLEKKHDVHSLKIINPTQADLETLAMACKTTVEQLDNARDLRVYETNETARVPSQMLVELFFRLKPFLPRSLQLATKIAALRRIFFSK